MAVTKASNLSIARSHVPSIAAIFRCSGTGGSTTGNLKSFSRVKWLMLVREFDFDLTPVPVSTRTSKGLTVTKWPVKEVKAGNR